MPAKSSEQALSRTGLEAFIFTIIFAQNGKAARHPIQKLMDRQSSDGKVRSMVVQGLAHVEDIVYAGLGILLAAVSFALLYTTLRTFISDVFGRVLVGQIGGLLDQILLILLVVELLYTVQVSFREHELRVEPFLVVSLIAVIRRILVLTAELPKNEASPEFSHFLLELGLLTVMVVVLVAALLVLQRQNRQQSIEGQQL